MRKAVNRVLEIGAGKKRGVKNELRCSRFFTHNLLPAPSEGRCMMGEIGIVGREPFSRSLSW